MKRMMTITALFLLTQISTVAFAKTVNVSVKGMVCSFCAQGIKKKFSKEDAVQKIDVSLEKHLVSLDLKDGKTLTDEFITTTLKDAGYSIERIERK